MNEARPVQLVEISREIGGAVTQVLIGGKQAEIVQHDDDFLWARCSFDDAENVSLVSFPALRLEITGFMDEIHVYSIGEAMCFLVWCAPDDKEKTRWGAQALFDEICDQLTKFPHFNLEERYDPQSIMLVASVPPTGTIGEAVRSIQKTIDEVVSMAIATLTDRAQPELSESSS
jgi:hypothetical protein